MMKSIHGKPMWGLLVAITMAYAGCAESSNSANQGSSAPEKDAPVTRNNPNGLRLPELNLCQGLDTGRERVAVKRLPKPRPGETITDPAFGVKMTRISKADEGQVVKPVYSTMQSWNADESLLFLYHTGGGKPAGHHLYDGKSYEYQHKMDIHPVDLEQVFWHHKDPDILFYVANYGKYIGKLIRYNVRTNTKEPLTDFISICGDKRVPTSGNGVMMNPINDDFLGFRCPLNEGQNQGFVYQISTGEIRKITLGKGTDYDKWTAPQPSNSGNYFFATDHILEKDLSTIRFTLDLAEFHSHGSLGQLSNGDDAFFTTAFDPSPNGCDGGPDEGVGSLVIHNFEKKTCEVIVSESKGYNYPGSGTHVSAVSYRRPGWALMSTISYGQFEYHRNNKRAPVLFSEIYLVNTDPKQREVCRIAHHRSFGKRAKDVSYHAYFGEPHATLSPSGTRLLFGSDWYGSGSVDTYVIELPAHRK